MLEMLLPEYTRQLMENYQGVFSQLASQLRWLYFDDASRLVTRVGYLDDGWIRLRLDGHWEFTGELLRELSWVFYNIAESNRLLDLLTGALASRATDKLRVSVVDVLPESPFNLAKVGGVALTGRDWSSDFARLQNLDVQVSSFTGVPDQAPPGRGVVLLGFDGTYVRRVRITSDGKLLVTLG